MKYEIMGFSQEYALTMKKEVSINGKIVTKKIDCTDLAILRWFVDFYPSMRKVEIDGVQYAWLRYGKLKEDLPIVDINKRGFSERLQKMVDFGILSYKLVKEGGTYSFYGFGENYISLVNDDRVRSNDIGLSVEQHSGVRSNDIGVCVQTTTKDTSIIDTSIIDISIKDTVKDIVDFLNQQADCRYKADTPKTVSLIKARMAEGFTVEDFKTVINHMVAEWKGTDMEKFLRPETLFGTKFESYLNRKPKQNNSQPAQKQEWGYDFLKGVTVIR